MNRILKSNATVFLLILTIAIIMRLIFVDLHIFAGDQIRDFTRAFEIVKNGNHQLFGSELFDGPSRLYSPAFYYLLAMPLSISASMELTVMFQIILAGFACALSFVFINLMFNKAAGIITGLAMAILPWPVITSIGLWNPYFSLFFAVFFMFSLYKWIKGNSKWFIPTLPFCGILFSLNIGNGYFILILIFSWIIFRPKTNTKHIITSFILLIAIFLPSIISELITGFANTGSLFTNKAVKFFRPEVFKVFSWIILIFSNEISHHIGRGSKDILAFYGLPSFKGILFISFNIFSILLSVSALFSFFRTTYKKKKGMQSWNIWFKSNPENGIIFLWLTVPILWFLLLRQAVEPRYLLGLFPAGFTIISIFVLSIYNKMKKPLIKKASIIFGILFFLNAILLNFHYRTFIKNKRVRYTDLLNVYLSCKKNAGNNSFFISAGKKSPYQIIAKLDRNKNFNKNAKLVFIPVKKGKTKNPKISTDKFDILHLKKNK